MVEGVAERPTGRLMAREKVRPLLLTVSIVAAVSAGLWWPGPWRTALGWVVLIVTGVLLWTRGPRVGVDRRAALLMLVPVLGVAMAITALWRAFSPRPYWRDYPGWGRKGWTVAVAFSAVLLAIGVWASVREAGWGAASYEDAALSRFEGSNYFDGRVIRASIQGTIAVGRGRRLAVVRVETAGGSVFPDVVDLSARNGLLGTVWERKSPHLDEYRIGCATDTYCLDVFQPHAVSAGLEPTNPVFASRLESVPIEVPVRDGVVFIRNRAQVRAITSGVARLVAHDGDGDEVPKLRQIALNKSLTGRAPTPGVVVVEE